MQINSIAPISFIKSRNSINKTSKNTISNQKEINLNSNPMAISGKNSISFGAMKKSQFNGIDIVVVNQYKAPIEKFNTNDDFQNWCKDKINSDFSDEKISELSKSLDLQAQMQKEAILKEWKEYTGGEGGYTPSIQLMILDSISKNLDYNTNHLPPVLNKRIVADTIQEISDNAKKDKNYKCNFDKIYRNNIQQGVLKTETQLDKDLNGWIIIPSKTNDPNNFEENVKKLQTLSHDNWCTKTYNAGPYLAQGDFHIYYENGKPKLGVRFYDNEIQEIQGEENNGTIPVRYLEIAKEHTKDCKLDYEAKDEFTEAEEIKQQIEKIKKRIGEDAFKNKEYDKILTALGYKVEKDEKDGMLILDYYSVELDEESDDVLLFDLIDTDDLFKHVKEIKGDAYFRDSEVTSLGKLQSIGGDADFRWSEVTSLGNLQSIGGDANFSESNITSLGNLEHIGGCAAFYNSKITSLDNLQIIGWHALFQDSEVTSLGNLQSIGGDAAFSESKITSLDNLRSIGQDAYFAKSKVTSLGNLERIGGNACFNDSEITSLGNLQSVGGNVYLKGSKNTSLDDICVKGEIIIL